MNTEISTLHERFIEQAIHRGVFRNRSEALDQAVALLKQREDLKQAIRAGVDSGPAISAGQVFGQLERRAAEIDENAS
jgi:putative addiction module CopG family antidote